MDVAWMSKQRLVCLLVALYYDKRERKKKCEIRNQKLTAYQISLNLSKGPVCHCCVGIKKNISVYSKKKKVFAEYCHHKGTKEKYFIFQFNRN